jgi:hypothetical protein
MTGKEEKDSESRQAIASNLWLSGVKKGQDIG